MKRDQEVGKVSNSPLKRYRVSECSLVIGYWPFRCAHYSQIVVHVRVDAAKQGVLGGETGFRYYGVGEVERKYLRREVSCWMKPIWQFEITYLFISYFEI